MPTFPFAFRRQNVFVLVAMSALLLNSSPASAAACCGGGFSTPSLIAGDEKAQFSAAYSFNQIKVDNVDAGGIWREWDEHQSVQMLRLEAAHLLSDRWQAGLSAPLIQRSRSGQNYSGLGDLSASLGYEYLPDWDYNPYRPRGLGYLQVTLPTGKARAESEVGGMDSRGNGFLAVAVGTLLSKTFGRWDAFSTLEAHRSFSKAVNNTQLSGDLRPAYGSNLGFGAGYNTRDWRFGSSLTWTYEDAVEIQGSFHADGSIERYATGALSASYLHSPEWSGTLSYSDQTLFGDPVNTSLGRGVVLQLQHRWQR